MKTELLKSTGQNEYLNSSLQSLVEKVYKEGIEKANEEAQQIIADAKQQSAELLKEAEQRVATIKEQSLNEVSRLRENLNSELHAVARQTVNTAKNELADVLSNKIASKGIDEALGEKEFLQKIILTVLQKWNTSDADLQFELLLNKIDEEQFRSFFEQRIKKELAANLDIVIEGKIKSGFRIGVKNESYHVDFSGEEFEKFFKGYLRGKTLEWIYGEKEADHE